MYFDLPSDVLAALITTFGSITVGIISAIALVYNKIIKHIDKKSEEQRVFSDMSVQKLNGLLTSVIHSFDRPAWLKIAVEKEDGEIEFRMSEINDAYTKLFGITRLQYLGRTDLEVGHKFQDAKRFKEHDLMVWASGTPQTFKEMVNDEELIFRKVRLTTLDGKTKGIFGYQVNLNCVKNETAKK